jgi:hypothetical protein
LPDSPPIRGQQDKDCQPAAGQVLLIAEILVRCDDGGEAFRFRGTQQITILQGTPAAFERRDDLRCTCAARKRRSGTGVP